MFGFYRRKNKNQFLIYLKENPDDYVNVLTSLSNILNKSQNHRLAEVTDELIELLKQEKFDEFIKLINGVDMWGGPGAVWEVYIANCFEEKEFQRTIISLIDLMERAKILGSGIKPIRRLFRKELGL
ncbi:hypothetical protein CAP36_04350 [Chitinophagaceae bacterium IBVUCB2]|nr:hypothetical protein CAP36_04350 [Chitinophagaceae bacterium IBVUCB2]